MSEAKREAWLNIYNSFTDFKEKKNWKERRAADDKRFSLVSSQEDFYELFRNWKHNATPLSATETHKMLNQEVNV